MVDAPQLFVRAVERCRRRGGGKNVVKHELDHIDASFTSEHKRGLYVLRMFRSLLAIVGDVVHAAELYAKHVRFLGE